MHIDNLTSIVEDYISDSVDGNALNKRSYKRRIQLLNKSDDQIHEILIEIENDCRRELAERSSLKSAKRKIILSLLVGFVLAFVAIISALGYLFDSKTTVLFYGGITGSIIYGSQNYKLIHGVEQRKKRRALKWDNWK